MEEIKSAVSETGGFLLSNDDVVAFNIIDPHSVVLFNSVMDRTILKVIL